MGSAWLVGRVVSIEPPWSTDMSIITEPGFISETISSVTSMGALAPGIRTAQSGHQR